MARMIDLHSHIAWNVDDGIQEKETTIQSLEQANQDGIVAICSTPHVIPGKTSYEEFQKILSRQAELMELGHQHQIYIYSGAEMMMNIDFLEALDQGVYQTLNETKYMLVEFDLRRDIHNIPYIFDYLEEMTYRSFVPVIAHVERFFPKKLDMDYVERFLDLGCILQANRTSLLGHHGKNVQNNLMRLLDEGWIHYVASDTHSVKGHRIEKLSDAYSVISKKYGKKNADLLFWDNPLAILNGQSVQDMD